MIRKNGVDSMIMLSLLSESSREKVLEASSPMDGDDSNFLCLPSQYRTEPSVEVETDA